MKSKSLELSGTIEVMLKDAEGNIIRRESKRNTVTLPAKRLALYDIFAANAGPSNLLRKQSPVKVTPAYCGIYCLSTETPITKDTMLPPYVGDDRSVVDVAAIFRNVASSTAAETAETMTPVNGRSYFDPAANKMIVEYDKISGSGTVKSIIIGRDHATKNLHWGQSVQDALMPADFFTGVAQHLIEPTIDSTIIHGSVSSTGIQYAGNIKTKELAKVSANSNLHTNITTYYTGLVMKDTVYKVAYQSAETGASGNITTRLTFVKNFKGATAAATVDLVFTGRAGINVVNSYRPVLVARPDNGTLEVFQTVSVGKFGETYGANVWKAVITLAEDGTPNATEFVDLGIIPYAVSNYTTISNGYYMVGTYHDGKYCLPVHSIINGYGTEIVSAANNYQEGIEISEDFETVHRGILYRQADGQSVAYIVGVSGEYDEYGEFLPIQIALAQLYYVYWSQVFSGLVFDDPFVKTPSDVLCVVYKYSLE
jgi:hypothetical protein